MRSSPVVLAAVIAVGLAACGSTPPPRPVAPVVPVVSTAQMAEANLSPASASLVSGRLALVPDARGVHITVA